MTNSYNQESGKEEYFTNDNYSHLFLNNVKFFNVN